MRQSMRQHPAGADCSCLLPDRQAAGFQKGSETLETLEKIWTSAARDETSVLLSELMTQSVS
jgi:hypothetical protein